MHNISKDKIKALLDQLSQALATEKSEVLLELSRDLHEKLVLFNYQASLAVFEKQKSTPIAKDISSGVTDSSPVVPPPIIPERELTVQERIEQIMATAPKFDTPTNPKLKGETPITAPIIKKETATKPDITSFFETKEATTSQTTNTEATKTPEEPKPSLPTPKENTDKTVISTQKPVEDTLKPTESLDLKASLEAEFKDAISADYAADLFEKATKVIPKKSLNDSLSQTQIQIGLNDRIAFVKHLFEGSQADFNRVLSQLNSFSTEAQAKHFINMTVKPDYNWTAKLDYEERFMELIERRFL